MAPIRADQLAQIQALGLDAAAKLPVPDLSRIGLVYIMDDASRRGLAILQVLRWGRPNVATVTATHYAGVQLQAGRRILRVHIFEPASIGAQSHFMGIYDPDALVALAFDGTATTTQVDADFGFTEPGDLVHVSRITSGAWLSATRPFPTAEQTRAWPVTAGEIDTRHQWPTHGVDVPPGHALLVQSQAGSVDMISRFWAEEIGP